MSQVIPFKTDPDFLHHNSKAVEDMRVQLASIILDLESLDLARADAARDLSDMFIVVKSKGFNVKAIKKVLSERKRDKGDLAEEQQIIDLYKSILGM